VEPSRSRLCRSRGGGWRREVNRPNVRPGHFSLRCFDLPLPRRGVLSGKSPRTSRRWRLFVVRFVCAFLNRAVEVPRQIASD
jgi:hypothetical protein